MFLASQHATESLKAFNLAGFLADFFARIRDSRARAAHGS